MTDISKVLDATILVVDDELGPREYMRAALKNIYNVKTATNGEECMELIKENHIDLTLLDVKMPDVDGIEVLRRIKNINYKMPVIIVTGCGTHQTAIDAIRLGASNFIAKPFKIEHVRNIVKDALVDSKKREELPPWEYAGDTLPSIEDVIRSNYLSMLKSLCKVLEAKDPYTREHSRQVADYAVKIAREMKFSDEEIEIMEQAALLHDIGKIGISDRLLKQVGNLTPEEISELRKHPEIGDQFLEPLKIFHIEQAMIRHHHEHYDGNGYPDRLRGENIPIYARILAVADAFDAMTSNRAYNVGKSFDDALDEIIKGSGTQFDPKVVEVFVRVMKFDKYKKAA